MKLDEVFFICSRLLRLQVEMPCTRTDQVRELFGLTHFFLAGYLLEDPYQPDIGQTVLHIFILDNFSGTA